MEIHHVEIITVHIWYMNVFLSTYTFYKIEVFEYKIV